MSREERERPRTPVLDDIRETPGISRGELFRDALGTMGIDLRGKTVLDLGAGYGSLSLAAAHAGAGRVVSVDIEHDRLLQLRNRVAKDATGSQAVCGNLLSPPIQRSSGDVAFLIGVVEYAGLWDVSRPVEDVQRRVFRAAFDMLRPGGVLVFGSKNRLWPRFAVADPHTGLPLVNLLPRSVADAWHTKSRGTPYRHHIHPPSGWMRLLRSAGFASITPWDAYFSYQFPLRVVRRAALGDLEDVERQLVDLGDVDTPTRSALGASPSWRTKALLMAAAGSIGIRVTHSVLMTATKGRPGSA